MNTSSAKLNEEQDVNSLQEEGLNDEEIAGKDFGTPLRYLVLLGITCFSHNSVASNITNHKSVFTSVRLRQNIA